MTVAELGPIVEAATAAAARITDVKTAGVQLLNKLGQLVRDNASNPEVIRALGEAMTNNNGVINSSADEIMAAITANTPAEEPPPA